MADRRGRLRHRAAARAMLEARPGRDSGAPDAAGAVLLSIWGGINLMGGVALSPGCRCAAGNCGALVAAEPVGDRGSRPAPRRRRQRAGGSDKVVAALMDIRGARTVAFERRRSSTREVPRRPPDQATSSLLIRGPRMKLATKRRE